MSAPTVASQPGQTWRVFYESPRDLRKLSFRYGPKTRLADALAAERKRRAA